MKKIFTIMTLILSAAAYAASTATEPAESGNVKNTNFKSSVNVASNNCDPGTPCYVIKTSNLALSQAVNQNISEKQAISIIQNSIIPQIDFHLVTRLAMGNNWKTANTEQQTQITTLFKQMLIVSYSNAVSKFKGAQITINDTKIIGDKQNRAVVKSTMTVPNNGNSNNQPVNVEYNLAKVENNWKIYDVKIENVSIVTTYRTQFNDTVQKDGIQGLIEQLQAKVDDLKPGKNA